MFSYIFNKKAAALVLLIALLSGLGAFGGYMYARHKLRQQATVAAKSEWQIEHDVAKKTVAEQAKIAAATLFLPRAIYAVPGVETSVYFDNLVDAVDVNQLKFKVECSLGNAERRHWKVTPKESEVGEHPFAVTITDLKGTILAHADSVVKVAPSVAGEGRTLRFLIVGDSLTHASYYPHKFQQLMAQPGNPRLTFIGTNTCNVPKDVVHEGFGGWTWHDFLHHNEPGSAKVHHRDKSPFLYKDASGAVKLDIGRYLRENSPDGPPDLVLFQLGINDAFCQEKSVILKNAQTLVAEFRQAVPKAALAIWLTQPVNCSQAAFDQCYETSIDRRLIKTKQHQLAKALAETFGDREAEGIFTVPMQLGIDPVDDYPPEDSVHPSIPGYYRTGGHLYAWVKWWLAHGEDGAR